MGTWGTDLFDDDTASDIRDEYREQIEDGVDDAEAMRSTLASFDSYFDDPADPETAAISILALAMTQSKIGRLDPGIRSRALAAIDNGADLARWERDDPKSLPGRRAAREKVRAQLTGPQPAGKRCVRLAPNSAASWRETYWPCPLRPVLRCCASCVSNQTGSPKRRSLRSCSSKVPSCHPQTN